MSYEKKARAAWVEANVREATILSDLAHATAQSGSAPNERAAIYVDQAIANLDAVRRALREKHQILSPCPDPRDQAHYLRQAGVCLIAALAAISPPSPPDQRKPNARRRT